MNTYIDKLIILRSGYDKILACIESCNTLEQLINIPNMVESWIAMSNKSIYDIIYDRSVKSSKIKKRDSMRLCDSMVEMCETIDEVCREKAKKLTNIQDE